MKQETTRPISAAFTKLVVFTAFYGSMVAYMLRHPGEFMPNRKTQPAPKRRIAPRLD